MFSQLFGRSEREHARQPPTAQPSTASYKKSTSFFACLERDDEGLPRADSTPIPDELEAPGSEEPFDGASPQHDTPSRSQDRESRDHRDMSDIVMDLSELKEQLDEDSEGGSEDGTDSERSSGSEKEYQNRLKESRKKLQRQIKKVQDDLYNNPNSTADDGYITSVSAAQQDMLKSQGTFKTARTGETLRSQGTTTVAATASGQHRN